MAEIIIGLTDTNKNLVATMVNEELRHGAKSITIPYDQAGAGYSCSDIYETIFKQLTGLDLEHVIGDYDTLKIVLANGGVLFEKDLTGTGEANFIELTDIP